MHSESFIGDSSTSRLQRQQLMNIVIFRHVPSRTKLQEANGQRHDFSFQRWGNHGLEKPTQDYWARWVIWKFPFQKWGLLYLQWPSTRIRTFLLDRWWWKHKGVLHCYSYLMHETFGFCYNLKSGASYQFQTTKDKVLIFIHDKFVHFILDTVKFILKIFKIFL